MKYIGNCADWIESELIDFLLQSDIGDKVPSSDDHSNDPQFKYWINEGFPYNKINFTFIFHDSLDFPVELPTIFKHAREWWFSKLNPGDIVPWHADKFKYNEENIERYWVAMQNYIPGHIFMYEDKPFVDYKKGDIFLFDNPKACHGAANISFIPKLSLQVALEK